MCTSHDHNLTSTAMETQEFHTLMCHVNWVSQVNGKITEVLLMYMYSGHSLQHSTQSV